MASVNSIYSNFAPKSFNNIGLSTIYSRKHQNKNHMKLLWKGVSVFHKVTTCEPGSCKLF